MIDLETINSLGLFDELATGLIAAHPEPVYESEEQESTFGGGVVPNNILQRQAESLVNDVFLTAQISSGANANRVNETEVVIIEDSSRSQPQPEPSSDSFEENSQLQMMTNMNMHMHSNASPDHVSGNSDNDSPTGVGPIDLTASTVAAAQAPLDATLEYTPPKQNRKRKSNSESSSTLSQNATTKVKRASKKTKMYEHPDKSDPRVKRAADAKAHRERNKEEKMNLINQLSNVQDELNRSKDKNRQLERTTSEQSKQITNLKVEIKRKDDKIAELENNLKNEKDKNSLNPSQTREMAENFASVVDNFRNRPDSRPMTLIVSERLGKKKTYALTHEEVDRVCDNASMERACTITFDLDEEEKVGKPMKHVAFSVNLC